MPLNARTQSINPASLLTIRALTAAADMLALIKPPVPSSSNPDQLRHRHEYDGLVKAQCDAIDGVKDGLIQNPAACNFRAVVSTRRCRFRH